MSKPFMQRSPVAKAAALAICLLATNSVCAQWVVTDPGHQLSNVANSLAERAESIRQQINQGTQIGHQVTNLQRQLRQIEEAITQIQTLMADPLGMQALLGQNRPQLMSDSEITESQRQQCPDNGGSSPQQYVINIARNAIGASDPVLQRQTEICRRIVWHEAQRYNTMVRFSTLMETRSEQLRQIGGDAQRANQPGQADGQNLASNQWLSAFLSDAEKAKLSYDFHVSMVDALKTQQSYLASMAMSGRRPSGLLGMATQSLVQGAALEAALRIDR